MPKCFITGVEVALEESSLLDVSAARYLLRDLHQRVASLQRLIDQLGERDEVNTVNRNTGVKFVRRDHRLVSRSIAQAIAEAFPERNVFIEWTAYRARWEATKKQREDGNSGESNQSGSDNEALP